MLHATRRLHPLVGLLVAAPFALAQPTDQPLIDDDDAPLIDEGDRSAADEERGSIDLIDAAPQQRQNAIDSVGPPPLARAVIAVTEADFLTDEERAGARVFHGLWTAADLDHTPHRALAALIAGDLLDPALAHDNDATPLALRLRAAVERGEEPLARELLARLDERQPLGDPPAADAPTFAALSAPERLLLAARVELLAGDRDAAEPLLQQAADFGRERLADDAPPAGRTDAAALTAAAEAVGHLARLRGEPAATYREILGLLSAAHQRADRLYWPALAAEAELLFDKGAWPQAQQAALQTLSLNPRAERTWSVLGAMAAGSFSVDAAESVAARLQSIAGTVHGPSPTVAERNAVSPAAALVLSRIRVRQNDIVGADEALDPALDAFPQHRELLARHAAVEALTYDDSLIQTALDRFERHTPGAADALFAVGETLSERRQYDQAAGYLQRAIDREPRWSAPVVELALLEMQTGRDDLALPALRRAVQLDPFNTRAKNSLALAELLLDFDTIDAPAFRIRYKPGPDRALAIDAALLVEDMHQRVVAEFGFAPAEPTLLEFMPDNEFFSVRVTGMPEIFTMAASTGPVIAMGVPRDGKLHKGEYDWLRVLTHEYVHTVTLAKTNNRIPHWFTEAAAVYMEQAPRDYSWWRLLENAWRNGSLFGPGEHNLGFIRPETPQHRTLAYAQAEWMYEWMRERFGDRAPRELMTRYAEGFREDEAMRDVLGVSAQAAYDDFFEWAGRQLEDVGLVVSPSLDALTIDETLADPILRDAALAELAATARTIALRPGAVRLHHDEAPAFQPQTIPTDDDTLAVWLLDHPEHPEILRLAVRDALADTAGRVNAHVAELLERYSAARPVDPEPHKILTRHYLATDQPERAVPHLRFLADREAYSPAYAVELARRYADLRDWPAALDYAVNAVLIAPYDANLRELAAEAALRARNFDAARWHLEALTMLEPDRQQHQRRLAALARLEASSN